MFFQDETDDPYPVDGTLEEKAAHGLEQVRAGFFSALEIYNNNKVGGPHHAASVMISGQASADQHASRSEQNFRAFLKNAFLTEDGQSTDPKYPVDKMINRELRRQRAVIILATSQYMYRFRSMMPDNPATWVPPIILFNMTAFINKYNNNTYDQLDFFIPGRNIKPRSTSALSEFVEGLSFKYSDNKVTQGLNKDYLVDRIRDELIEFLLQDIPYNNKALEQKKELIADEKAKPKEAKPVLH